MPKRKRKRRRPVEWVTHYCAVKAWHVSYWNNGEPTVVEGRLISEEAAHHLDLELDVELLEPVREVHRGRVRFTSPTKVHRDSQGHEIFDRLSYGGLLWYRSEDGERVMSGFVRSSASGNLALISLLNSGRDVILDHYGHVFYYREARVKYVSWYTSEHPDLLEELADRRLMRKEDLPI